MLQSFHLRLFAVFFGMIGLSQTVSGDVNIVIYKPSPGLHYCIVPQSYASHQRLVPRLGNCCQRNRLVFMYDRIQDEIGSYCLVEVTNTDRQFKLGRRTDGNCALFKSKTKETTKGNCFELLEETFAGITCPTSNAATLEEMKCEKSPTVIKTDLRLSMVHYFEDFCWYPENKNFGSGTRLKDSKHKDCCSMLRFSFKSDKTLWVGRPGIGLEYCVYIDGMNDAKKMDELNGRNVKMGLECKATAFEVDQTYQLLKIIGTNYCIFRRTSQEIELRQCYTYDYAYKETTCGGETTTTLAQPTPSHIWPHTPSFQRGASTMFPHTSHADSTKIVKRLSAVVSRQLFPMTSSKCPLSSKSVCLPAALTNSTIATNTTAETPNAAVTPSIVAKPTAVATIDNVVTPTAVVTTNAVVTPNTVVTPTAVATTNTVVTPTAVVTSSTVVTPITVTKPITGSDASASTVVKPTNVARLTIFATQTTRSVLPIKDATPSTAVEPTNIPSILPPTTSPSTASPTPTSPKKTEEELPFVQVFTGTPVNGQYGNWTRWSKCSVECGTGIQKRIRYCDSPAPRNGGKHCTGKSEEEAQCTKPKCSGRSLAGDGEDCDSYCKSLGLTCSTLINSGNSNQDFIKSGVNCSSNENGKVQSKSFHPSYVVKTEECNGYIINDGSLFSCNASAPSGTRRLCNCITEGDQGYGEWVPWSSCSLTCGGGTRRRTRNCNSANPSEMKCIGNSTEVEQCNMRKCPIDGGFSEWSQWSSCSKSCDGGVRDRNRTCSNPYPEYGGAICYGYYKESRSCGNGFCPVDGGWTLWTEWHHCDKPCNTGKISRERWCENPTPMYGGRPCKGYNNESALCNTKICPNSSILLTDILFDLSWVPGLKNQKGADFHNFSRKIDSNVEVVLGSEQAKTYEHCWLHSLRKGSVIASFTLYFNALDSFQFLYLMDAIDVDHFLGKMPIVQSSVANFSSKSVPSSSPANVTASVHNITTIIVSWNEVPTAYRNGLITGYIVFYKEAASPDYTSIGTNKTSETILGLHPATEYLIRVLAYTPNGNGIASKMIRIFTQEKAPTLPPTQVSTTTLSSTVIFLEWNHPPVSSWNGVLRGYRIKLLNSKSTIIKIQTVAQDARFANIDSLTPGTTYLIDICPFTKAGVGPCFRTSNMTFVSAPSVAPGNLTGSNKTSVDSIDVTFGTIPLKYIHGYLKGYKIEYRVHRIGLAYDQDEVTQSVMVGPFVHKATLKSMLSNAVYAIRVMAVNQHGDGVKSPIVYAETCTCPSVIYTNYALMIPYIFRDKNGNMKGIFMNLLENSTRNICGLCKGKPSTVDYVNDGKNGWASKASLVQVTKGVDDYTHVSFVISGRTELASYLGRPYVAAVDHPGMILFIPKETVAEQVSRCLNLLWNLWPIFVINLAFICLAGIIYFCLTARETPQTESCCFGKGAITGMYWAYVTMFTHGYGDIVPSAIIPRTFAIIWILVGLVTSAILMGAITSVLTTASVLGEAKVYGKQLAAVEGSKEQFVGIYRNAKVNTKKKYKTVDEVYRALKNREVYAGLVDSYVAANRPDLFSDSAIIARKMIKYPYTYGFVLSGSMRNADSNLRQYFTENSNYISQMVEKTTKKFQVNVDEGGTVSLFDPKSPVLRKNLIILSVITVVVFIIGCLYSLFKNKYRKCKVVTHGYESPLLDDCELLCQEFFTNVEELSVKMDKLYENQLRRILKLQALRKKFPQTQDSIRVTRLDLSSPDSGYLMGKDPARTGDVIVKCYNNQAFEGDNAQ